ncbi:amidase signature domain-containing protein [Gigaspora rosea]|uniref:Glutamyl-tRNA(Gln) amidotransferase subunit A, mitochondrial n=1 Tax=Gigaspora rosea TaxID=44941 RepID=A0A397VXM2_9GLOM|nr:amidase signature domain-containing protein [Gigaspora rosea]
MNCLQRIIFLSNFSNKKYIFSYALTNPRCKLSFLSVTKAQDLLQQKKVTSVTLVRDCFSQISKYNARLNAFIKVQNENVALEKAIEADDRFNKGIIKGPLDGIPITYKDNFCTKELSTTCDFISPFNATIVDLLQDSGAIMIGKTNMDEFGMGAFGPAYNPHTIISDQKDSIDQEPRVAGGSSGGSAAAVASGMCFASLGSDTGGSIRLPASYCGVIGFKPSYGQCSRWGLVAYASSLDTVGIITRNVHDAQLIYDIISKYDEKDPSSLPPKLRSINASLASFEKTNSNFTDLSKLRVGIPQEYYVSELSDPIKSLWKRGISLLRSYGATIVSVSCPSTRYALPAYYILAPAEASSNLARYDGVRYGHRSDMDSKQDEELLYAHTRSEGFGEEVKRRILLGTYTLTAGSYNNYFIYAQRIRKMVQSNFDSVFRRPNPLHLVKNESSSFYNRNSDEIFEISNKLRNESHGVDVIMTPVAISTSPKVKDSLSSSFLSNSDNAKNLDDNSFVNAYVNDVFTIPANLAGIPAISVPFGISPIDGFPIGLQLMTQYGDEHTLFYISKVLENNR